MKHKTFGGEGGKKKQSRTIKSGVKKKTKWVPAHKPFEGSVGEGQGFAYKRKQKAKHEYNKLLRTERRKKNPPQNIYKEEYPEHLKHLYLAEKEKLKKEAWTMRVNRSKLRSRGKDEGLHEADTTPQMDFHSENRALEETDHASDPIQAAEPDEKEHISIPLSNRMRKKLLWKTSYQKTKEEYEGVREKRMKKKEEYLKNKQQREEALQKYKQKKMQTYNMLCKKTKKGQPNLNLQMEYLLQKIQSDK